MVGFDKGVKSTHASLEFSCLAAAPHELLMRSQNAAYLAAMQKIDSLTRQIQHLQGELGGQK